MCLCHPCVSRCTAQHYAPQETPQKLRNVVGAPCGTSRKHKRNNDHDQLVTDVDTWLQEARQPNNTEAVHWFTRTILHQTTTTTPSRKKPRTLNMLHMCWTTILSRMEDLTGRHLRTMTHNYQHASLCAHAMKHLRDLGT